MPFAPQSNYRTYANQSSTWIVVCSAFQYYTSQTGLYGAGLDNSLDLLEGLDLEGLPLDVGESGDQGDVHFFGPYQLIQQVGAGGVAKVWRARHIHPGYADKTFAIKVLHDDLSRDPQVVQLFRHEAYVLSLLKHANIVETFEAGSQDEKLFIAMEYIDGRDLENLIARCQSLTICLPIPVVMYIVSEILKALSYAHNLSDGDDKPLHLVHRDINPANVFLSFDGRVKLGDFGVASLAAGRDNKGLMGKPGYFAPEQIEGQAPDQRGDIFALGVTLFELLCGTRLFDGNDVDTILKLNRKAKIPKPTKLNPKIPAKLEQVMLQALARKPQARFESAQQMLNALGSLIPDPVGMPLAVAAMLRKAFANEHMQELRLREGLAGTAQTRGAGQLVWVCSPEARAREAFKELLESRGYRVVVTETMKGEGASGLSETNPPALCLVDICGATFGADSLRQILAHFKQPVTVVAFAEQLELAWIKRAGAIGAVDLLFKPYNIERVLTSVRSAISGAAKVATIDPFTAETVRRTKPKVLILSQDATLMQRLSGVLSTRGYDIEVSPTTAEALERTRHSSHHAVVFDAYPPRPADRFFASHFRGQPGMGLVPILYLTSGDPHHNILATQGDRSAVRSRDDPPQVAIETLNRLRGDTRLGRTFLRYPASFGAELRYGGRVFSGTVTDVSRGGVKMTCAQQMPPVGTEVNLSLDLPDVVAGVQVAGRVARVDLPSTQDVQTQVGVEYERFSGRGETELISFLGTLDREGKPGRRSTTIIGPPPPATQH